MLAESYFDCCEAFGEVIGEGEFAVVGCFQVTVQPDALAAEITEVDVVAAAGSR